MHEEMTAEIKAALDECRGIIRKGSKSFSLAARLFDPATRDAAFFLYGWCRYCDDQVDAVGKCETPDVVLERVKTLKERTAAAFGFVPQNEPVFIALQYIAHRYAIPAHYALELIEGMAMDARGTRYTTLKELLLYCYRVAGTVENQWSGQTQRGFARSGVDAGAEVEVGEICGRGRIDRPAGSIQIGGRQIGLGLLRGSVGGVRRCRRDYFSWREPRDRCAGPQPETPVESAPAGVGHR